MTRVEIETALDKGLVQVHTRNGNWWKLRRNGATKTWKTRPAEFRIPVKAGLRSCTYITHDNMNNADLFRIGA